MERVVLLGRPALVLWFQLLLVILLLAAGAAPAVDPTSPSSDSASGETIQVDLDGWGE